MNYESTRFADIEDEETVYNCFFEGEQKLTREIDFMSFDGCIFRNIDFTNINIKSIELVDVIFEDCDLSQKKFDC